MYSVLGAGVLEIVVMSQTDEHVAAGVSVVVAVITLTADEAQ